MNLTEKIESAELRFRRILEEFFVSVYPGKRLPSHGIEHHRRVWNNARELLLIHDSLTVSSFPDLSKLIIACYMHDIGMSADPGPDHGRISRELCLRFLVQHDLDRNSFADLLESIENHDKKEYNSNSGFSPLLMYLSLADDMDAFGYRGIYRYSEIYLIRGIPPPVIGLRIQENAALRFGNFRKYFRDNDPCFKLHEKEYHTLDTFFSHYNRQALSYSFEGNEPEAYCGVMQLIINFLRNEMTINDMILESEIYADDVVIGAFFKGLESELGI